MGGERKDVRKKRREERAESREERGEEGEMEAPVGEARAAEGHNHLLRREQLVALVRLHLIEGRAALPLEVGHVDLEPVRRARRRRVARALHRRRQRREHVPPPHLLGEGGRELRRGRVATEDELRRERLLEVLAHQQPQEAQHARQPRAATAAAAATS